MLVYGEIFWQQIVITFSPPSDLLLKSNFILNNNTCLLSNIGNSVRQLFLFAPTINFKYLVLHSLQYISGEICKIEYRAKSCSKSHNLMQIYRPCYIGMVQLKRGGGGGSCGWIEYTVCIPVFNECWMNYWLDILEWQFYE